jgi:hypothetical protein
MLESLDGGEDASRGSMDRREPEVGRGGKDLDPKNPPVPSPDLGDPRGRGLGPHEGSCNEDWRSSGALEFCIGSIVIDIDSEVSPTSDSPTGPPLVGDEAWSEALRRYLGCDDAGAAGGAG